MDEIEKIRVRLKGLGWRVTEIPARSGGVDNPVISRWKLIAAKGEKTISVEGKTLLEGMNHLGNMLGVI
jgi:hypothetical protein